ncbi:hypothetical protein TNCV_4307991 [Trichonephila clavipes]|nr:hypothetical protein TNCV_4307991 [Trichonephila clavipes]
MAQTYRETSIRKEFNKATHVQGESLQVQGLEPATHRPRARDHNHKTTAATITSAQLSECISLPDNEQETNHTINLNLLSAQSMYLLAQ